MNRNKMLQLFQS